MRNLTELDTLESWLATNGYKYTREDEDDTFPPEMREKCEQNGVEYKPMDLHQIVVYKDGVRSWDVICQRGSYGCEEGLLEGMGDLFGTDVEGWLTAADVIQRLEEAKQCGTK